MGKEKMKLKLLLIGSCTAMPASYMIQSDKYANGSNVSGNWGGRTQTGYTWPAGWWFNKYWPCDYNAVVSGQVQYPGCRPTVDSSSAGDTSLQNGIITTNGDSGTNGIITTNNPVRPDAYLQANQVLVDQGPLSAI